MRKKDPFRITVFVEDPNTARGRFVIYPNTTINEVRTEIFESMLDEEEKKKAEKMENFILKINGTMPIRAQQNNWEAVDLFEKGDYILAVFQK